MISKRIIGPITELYISGGNSWITETKPTCYRTFSKQRPLVGSQKETDYTEWTDADKTAWEAKPPKPAERNDATPLYEAAGAKLNEATGYYEMHDGAIVDLTEEDMALIVELGFPGNGCEGYYFSNKEIRTHAVMVGSTGRGGYAQTFRNCKRLEVVRCGNLNGGGQQMFDGCSALRAVLGPMHITGDNSDKNTFKGCVALVDARVLLGAAGAKVSFADSPLISQASLQLMATATTALANSTRQVILHPKTYAKLTAEIVDTATAKGITFVEASAHCDGTPYTDEELA